MYNTKFKTNFLIFTTTYYTYYILAQTARVFLHTFSKQQPVALLLWLLVYHKQANNMCTLFGDMKQVRFSQPYLGCILKQKKEIAQKAAITSILINIFIKQIYIYLYVSPFSFLHFFLYLFPSYLVIHVICNLLHLFSSYIKVLNEKRQHGMQFLNYIHFVWSRKKGNLTQYNFFHS